PSASSRLFKSRAVRSSVTLAAAHRRRRIACRAERRAPTQIFPASGAKVACSHSRPERHSTSVTLPFAQYLLGRDPFVREVAEAAARSINGLVPTALVGAGLVSSIARLSPLKECSLNWKCSWPVRREEALTVTSPAKRIGPRFRLDSTLGFG